MGKLTHLRLDEDGPPWEEELFQNKEPRSFGILEKLAEMGQGRVYNAQDLSNGNFVAIKMFKDYDNRPKDVAKTEGLSLQKVVHPNVVKAI